MSADLDALVASPWWQWRPSMRTTDGRIVAAVYGGWLTTTTQLCGAVSTGLSATGSPDNRPDIDDPATQGFMLALVRKAYGPDASIEISLDPDGACVSIAMLMLEDVTARRYFKRVPFSGATLGLALAAALLAAPAPEAPSHV
jgi:hypothetical protein